MSNNSTPQPDQPLLTVSAQPSRLGVCLSTIFCKTRQVSPSPSGTELEARTSFALSLPAFLHHLKLARQIAGSPAATTLLAHAAESPFKSATFFRQLTRLFE